MKNGYRGSCKKCELPMVRESQIKSKFGITTREYNKMLRQQGGVCAICHNPEQRCSGPGTSDHLCVDHDHTTGVVRGLLCRNCNSAIGLVGDDVERLLSCIVYLKKNA